VNLRDTCVHVAYSIEIETKDSQVLEMDLVGIV